MAILLASSGIYHNGHRDDRWSSSHEKSLQTSQLTKKVDRTSENKCHLYSVQASLQKGGILKVCLLIDLSGNQKALFQSKLCYNNC